MSSKRIFNHPTIQFLFEKIAENDKMYPIPLSKANILIPAKVAIKVDKTRLDNLQELNAEASNLHTLHIFVIFYSPFLPL